jgi:signal transduction histidine kinase
MMPKVLEEFGLISAIREMLDKSLKLTNIRYEFEHFNFDERLERKIELSLYRVTQELINNVIKHSKATMVSVQLFKSGGYLVLIVEDNGKGIENGAATDGHGMLNIRSRLTTIHGNVNFEASPNAGTTATIRIKLES